jgi:hypothetical protein
MDFSTKQRKAQLRYITSGISWEPVYFLDIQNDKQAQFKFLAKIANDNIDNLTNTNVKLVAGSINLLSYNVGNHYYYDTMTQSALQSNAGFASAEYRYTAPVISALAEYYTYSLPDPISLNPQEIIILPMLDNQVNYKKEYVYDARTDSNRGWYNYNSWEQEASGKVQNIYKIMNEGQTLPMGIVTVYLNGMLIGEDSIQWTPKGKEAKITVGTASDIEAKRKETVKRINFNYNNYDYDHKIVITLKNYKSEKVTVKVLEAFTPEALNMSANIPYTEKPGNLMEWNIDLNAGQAKDLIYTFMTK